MKAPLVHLHLVREEEFSYKRMTCAREISQILGEVTKEDFDESFYAIALDTKNRILHVYPVAKGNGSGVTIKIGDIFRTVLIAGGNAVAIAHNHPCGDPEPSPEDLALGSRVREAADLLGIRFLDNIVIGERGLYWSAQEKGAM
jgi:DNA repair protein RadC